MTRPLLTILAAAAVAAGTLSVAADAANTVVIKRTGAPSTVFVTQGPLRGGPSTSLIIRQAPVLKLIFDCVVAGTPVEFPNDLYISNPHNFTVAAGTVAAYSGPYSTTSGTVVLPELKPGKGVYVNNAVPGGAQAGAACSASQV